MRGFGSLASGRLTPGVTGLAVNVLLSLCCLSYRCSIERLTGWSIPHSLQLSRDAICKQW